MIEINNSQRLIISTLNYIYILKTEITKLYWEETILNI